MSGSDKAAVGVAAAAILGAALLAHKSNHHESGQHHDDANAEAEFDQGYKDGLYNAPYHNYANSRHYSDGYSAGVDRRNAELNTHTNRGGYHRAVRLNGLTGRDIPSGDTEMKRRGFRNVDNMSSGNTAYSIWYHPESRQCIQIGVWDGKFGSVTDIKTHPSCR